LRKAQERIDSLRKGPIHIKVTDSEGNTIEGVNIELKMKRNATGFGTAVGARELMDTSKDGEAYRRVLRDSFNKATLENDLKWNEWEIGKQNRPSPRYAKRQTMQALEWLRREKFGIRGHYIAWAPVEKLRVYRENKENPGEFKKLLFSHIKEKIAETSGMIDEWDVINHIVSGIEERSKINLKDIYGEQIFDDIIKYADSLLADSVKLYLNEGQILTKRDGRADQYYNTIKGLIERDVPFDGIGFMGHFRGEDKVAPRQVFQILNRFAAFGLPLQITELDIRYGKMNETYNFSESELKEQANYMRELMTVFYSHPAVNSIVLWGFWENRHWFPSAALYNADWSLKPNGKVWKELVYDTWWTHEEGLTNSNGAYVEEGYYGTYKLVLQQGDKTKIKYLEHSSENSAWEIIF